MTVKKFIKFVSQSGDDMIYNDFYEVVEEIIDEGFQSGKGYLVVNSAGTLQAYDATLFQASVDYVKLAIGLSGVSAGTCVRVIKEYTHVAINSGHGYVVAMLVDNGTKKLVRVLGDPQFAQ